MAAAIQKLWPFFQSHAWRKENGDWQYAITNSSITISVFLLQSSNKLWKVHYVTANRFMYSLGWTNLYCRNCGSSLRACTLRKYVYNYSDLENRMSLASRTSNAIAMRVKIFALLYWMDWCILQTYLWKRLNIMEPFIHDKHARQRIHADWKQPTLWNRLWILPTLLYGYKYRTKGITFKHGLNIGWKYIQAINNSSPSTMNKRKFVLQALLTRIRLTKR